MSKPTDWIQQAVAARAAELGVSGRRLGELSGVSQQHISDYLAGRKTMGSWKLQHVLAALGLELHPASTARQ